MNKKNIIVLVLAAIIYLSGLAIGGYAKGEARRINSQAGFFGQRYTFNPPYANAMEARIGIMMRVPSFTTPIAIVMGIGGALWLIVSVQQKKNNAEN